MPLTCTVAGEGPGPAGEIPQAGAHRSAHKFRDISRRPRRCPVCRTDLEPGEAFCSHECAEQWADDTAY